jgi:hypothetical protein
MPSIARNLPPWADVARLASMPGGPVRLTGAAFHLSGRRNRAHERVENLLFTMVYDDRISRGNVLFLEERLIGQTLRLLRLAAPKADDPGQRRDGIGPDRLGNLHRLGKVRLRCPFLEVGRGRRQLGRGRNLFGKVCDNRRTTRQQEAEQRYTKHWNPPSTGTYRLRR